MKPLKSILLSAALLAGFFLIVHHSAGMANVPQEVNSRFVSPSVDSINSSQESTQDPALDAGSVIGMGDPFSIQPRLFISIPFGIDSPLPVLDAGQEVMVSGHGGCTQDELVTVVLTVTQTTSGAVATGNKELTCTGENMTWSTPVTVDSTPSLATDLAEACGTATTYDGIYQTDTFDWCRDVNLIRMDHSDYLPMIAKP